MELKRTDSGIVAALNEETFLIKVPKVREGLCTIENISTGLEHCAHPNIDKTGSVSEMKKRGFWREEDKIAKIDGYYYNMSRVVCSDELDKLCLSIERSGGLLWDIKNKLALDGICNIDLNESGEFVLVDTSKPILYKDFLEKEYSFQEYYGQFIDEDVKERVLRSIGIERILACNDGKNLSDIPVREWDFVFGGKTPQHIAKKVEETETWSSASTLVCIAKAAAIDFREAFFLPKLLEEKEILSKWASDNSYDMTHDEIFSMIENGLEDIDSKGKLEVYFGINSLGQDRKLYLDTVRLEQNTPLLQSGDDSSEQNQTNALKR